MAANSVNFFQPGTEAAVDANSIARQRQMADLLMQKGLSSPQGQMVSGHYVAPGAGSYIAQLVSALGAGYMGRQADERERTMVKDLAASRAKEANDFLGAMNGTPARTIPPATPNDDEGNPMPSAQVAAVPGDRNKALALALQSQNPQLQAMGGELMKQQMQQQLLADILRQAGGGKGGAAPSPAAGGAAPAGGGIPGVSPLAFALSGAGFKDLGSMVQDASKPIPLREGDLVLPDGQGGFRAAYSQPKLPAGMVPTRDAAGAVTGAKVLPGFQAGNAGIAGAEAQAREAAAAENALQTIDIPGVGPVTKTKAQWMQQMGNGAPRPSAPAMSAPASAPLPPAEPGVTGNFQGDPQQIVAAIQDIRDPQERSNAMAALQQQMRSTNASSGPLTGAAAGGIVGQDKAAQEYDTARAKDFAKAAADYQDRGRSAGSTLRNLDTLEQLYKDPNVAKGGMAESISGLKNVAASLGVETKGLGAEQAIEAITNKMALDSRSTAEGGGMPGAMSDADRNFLKAQQPGLAKTPEGRALIIDSARKLAQRQQQIAQMANEYERQNGRLDVGFDRAVADFAAKNPMFANQKPTGASAAPAAPDFRSLAAQELARRRAKNGG